MDFGNVLALGHLLLLQGGNGGGAGGGEQGPQSLFTGMLPLFIIFIAIMYFLMIRPQQKREKERREMLASLSKGDEVVTTGGICGTVVGLSDNNVVLRVDADTKIEFVRQAVAQITSHHDEDDSAEQQAS